MIWLSTALAVVALVSVAVVVLSVLGVPERLSPVVAVLRATAQLAALGLVLQGIINDVRWIVVALIVMNAVAVWTTAQRVDLHGTREWAAAVGAVPAGALAAAGVVFATGALPMTPEYLLAFGGIMTGNSMTIASLAGRGFFDRVGEGWDEIEGWLALGARPAHAAKRFVRLAAGRALMPSVDQARTAGLVTLPGAFVGAVFGGASPVEAARFQLVVSSGVMAAGAVSAFVLLQILAHIAVRPRLEAVTQEIDKSPRQQNLIREDIFKESGKGAVTEAPQGGGDVIKRMD